MIHFEVSAPGKVILFGEHAVVYGKTALAASVDLRTTVDFKELPENEQCIRLSMPKVFLDLSLPLEQIRRFCFSDNSPKVNDSYETFYGNIQKLVETMNIPKAPQRQSLEAFFYLLVSIAQNEGINVKPFEVNVNTALTIGSGLGSSASFAVSLATAFLHWSRLQKGTPEVLDSTYLKIISKYALNCERIMHGTPSGIDNSVCTYGSIIKFKKGESLEPIYGVKSMRVLLVDTRVQRSTKALVERLIELKNKYPNIFGPIFDAIDNVSNEALNIIKKMRSFPESSDALLYAVYQELMTLIELNQGLLSSCQTSHPSLDRICAEAKNYGLAAKLTGAGGGGYAYILLLPDTPSETISSISRKLIANGYLVSLTNLGGPGVQIHLD
ncbi:mevalonate kinase [Orussus abietinus]|uniref:mevalonate kinase n=1 Tax=Orussus abietinus TaxID=222816 RepID=UPI00062655A7|nr:mevalonate kinase [Orussus abietinus]